MMPSESAAGLLQPVEIFDVAAAHLSAERRHCRRGLVRPGPGRWTSCPAAMSSAMMYEPEWAGPSSDEKRACGLSF